MDELTATYLTNLAAELSALLIPKVARRMRESWQGDETDQAMGRCLHAGILGMVSKASADSPEEDALLSHIFSDFFRSDAVAAELMRLVRVRPLDLDELAYLFGEAGYDPETLPGLRFAEAVAAFEAAFLEAAALEPALRPIIQVGQRWAQTELQQEMVTQMRRLVQAQRQAAGRGLGIQAGQIVAHNVVSGTQQIDTQIIVYQWPAEPLASRAWEKAYLRALLNFCDPLDLADVDEYYAQDPESTVHISDVFSPLYLARDGQPLFRRPGQALAEAILKPRRPEMERSTREEEEGQPVSAVEAVGALDRLVILGYPGGGKSTLVNYLAVQMARRRQGEPPTGEALAGWPEEAAPLPVRIVLRRFAAALPEQVNPGPKAGLVWDYLEQTLLPQWGCRDAFARFRQTLTEEGGLILFDGLDEVRESDEDARRSLLKQAIADFAATLPRDRSKIVITCREYAYKKGDAWRLPDNEFPVVDLTLFGREQIQHFTQTWYRLTGPFKGWDEDRCAREADRLFDATQRLPHLQELAQYPLLLTLMAQVHGRDGSLPDDRADLYERAVNLLLAHWESRIERDLAGGQRVEPGLISQLEVRTETLKGALARVAFQVHEAQERAPTREERAADISRDRLWEELQAVLGSYDRAKQVTDYVQFRAGLLQARDRFTYTFPHRTFQEYLAAAHLWTMANPGQELRDRVRRDLTWWREVFLLAAGQQKAAPKNVAELVDWLLPGEARPAVSPAEAALATLAGQAIRETDFIRHTRPDDPAYKFTVTMQRIKGWLLASLVAGNVPVAGRAAAGRALGRLTWPDGALLDDREGLGFIVQDGIRLPDIDWGDKVIPAGDYTIGGDPSAWNSFDKKKVDVSTDYRLARYPVTVAQFDCFVSAADVDDERWWAGMPDEYKYGARISEPRWSLANHPRETVSWYQAVAFCRWLDHHLKVAGIITAADKVDLPHEYEWEVAARYAGDGQTDRRIYPWGGETITPDHANYDDTGLGQTSAVGLFPAGRQPELDLYDLSGNVWEWCRNKYEKPVETAVDKSGDWRTSRGGSWIDGRDAARAAYRNNNNPNNRNNNNGFRLVVRRPTTYSFPIEGCPPSLRFSGSPALIAGC